MKKKSIEYLLKIQALTDLEQISSLTLAKADPSEILDVSLFSSKRMQYLILVNVIPDVQNLLPAPLIYWMRQENY